MKESREDYDIEYENLHSEKNLLDDEKENHNTIEKRDLTKEKIAAFVDNSYVVIFMTIVTIYALFFDDIRLVVFTKSDDDIFFGITSACLFFFTLEIVLSSYSKPDEYFLSFFFWLDVVSTLSLIPDIGWIMDGIT
jgi:hypothetical protein